MKRKVSNITLLALLIVGLLLAACTSTPAPELTSESTNVPAGDPPFPSFNGSWIIDTTGTIDQATIASANATLQKLRDDGIAEVAILIIRNVKNPETYATRFGRVIKLGSSVTNNGFVYMIRPDVAPGGRLTSSVGRGLPLVTELTVTNATANAIRSINSGNFSAAVSSLVTDTNTQLRSLYKPNAKAVTGTSGSDTGEKQMTPEEKQNLLIGVGVFLAVWFLIGLAILPFDSEAAVQWWILGLRFIAALASAKSDSNSSRSTTGGSGHLSGRSRTQ